MMKKILLATAIALALATPTWAAQQDISTITTKTSREALRTAINTELGKVQTNTTELYSLAIAAPWLAQATAPSITNVFWVDTSGVSPVIKYYDGDSWEVAAAGEGGTYTLPVATSSVLGGVKQGAGTSIAADGTISVTAAGLGLGTTADAVFGSINAAGGTLSAGVANTTQGALILYTNTDPLYYFGITPAASPTAMVSLKAPPAMPTADNSLWNCDINGTCGWTDPATLGGGATAINDLTDVDTTGKATGKILKFDASGNLVVGDDSTGSGSVPNGTVNGQLLIWSTDQWVASSVPTWNQNTTGTAAGITGYSIVTTVGATGADTNLPSEQAVREAFSALPNLAFDSATLTTTTVGDTDTISVKANTFQGYDANMITWPVAINATEIGYLDGLTEALSTSLSGKQTASANLTSWSAIPPATGSINTTGAVQAKVPFNSYSTAQTLTSATHNSTVVQMTEAVEATMWDCETANVGDTVMLWARDAEKIEVVPASGDHFVLFNGTSLTADYELDVAATAGTKVTLICTADDTWSVFTETAASTDGGAAD